MAKPVLISGIQPTGKLHLGNYLGALRNFVKLQNSGEYQCYFFIADFHALTENPNPKDLRKNTIDLAAHFFAAGLNQKKSTIFVQSKVPAHLELYQILSPLIPVSELMRMTAFKEKVLQVLKLKEDQIFSKEDFEKAVEGSNFSLAAYPILMAADILLYDAKFVPVGHDQLQHLELTRKLARRFNKRFGKIFIEPKPLLTETPRLMSLNDPARKMSKSHPAGCLFLDDKPADIRKKIQRAVTDSKNKVQYDKKEANPAVSNLMLIYKELANRSMREIEQEFSGKGYAEFKKALAEVVVDALKIFREKKHTNKSLINVLEKGNAKATSVAVKKLTVVKKRIGLI